MKQQKLHKLAFHQFLFVLCNDIRHVNNLFMILKVIFIKNKKMGGIVTWSINSDYPSGHPRSLHDIIYNSLTRFPSSIDLSDNKICYSESIYPNIKNLKI